MPSIDYFVGFENKPRNLDAFLDGQGFNRIPNDKGNSDRTYESREGEVDGVVDVYFYRATKVNEGEVPDWRRSGFRVAFELMISTKDFVAADAPLRLAEETVKEYDGVLYDPNENEYLRREQL